MSVGMRSRGYVRQDGGQVGAGEGDRRPMHQFGTTSATSDASFCAVTTSRLAISLPSSSVS